MHICYLWTARIYSNFWMCSHVFLNVNFYWITDASWTKLPLFLYIWHKSACGICPLNLSTNNVNAHVGICNIVSLYHGPCFPFIILSLLLTLKYLDEMSLHQPALQRVQSQCFYVYKNICVSIKLFRAYLWPSSYAIIFSLFSDLWNWTQCCNMLMLYTMEE